MGGAGIRMRGCSGMGHLIMGGCERAKVAWLGVGAPGGAGGRWGCCKEQETSHLLEESAQSAAQKTTAATSLMFAILTTDTADSKSYKLAGRFEGATQGGYNFSAAGPAGD